jgi:hypothetical protein
MPSATSFWFPYIRGVGLSVSDRIRGNGERAAAHTDSGVDMPVISYDRLFDRSIDLASGALPRS